MSLSPQSSISLLAFAFTATVCVGLCSINRQLRSLKTQILKQDRYDANKDAKSSRAEAAADKIDLLLEMHSVLAHENVEDVIQRVVDVSYRLFSAQRISVMVLNRRKTHFTVLASKDTEGEEMDASKGIGAVVLMSGEMINVKNAYKDPRFDPEWDKVTGFRTTSLLCAPLLTSNETVGVVYVINKLDDDGNIEEFSKEDESLLEHFADTASVAIKKAQMYHDAIRREKNSLALLSIVRSRSSDEVLESIFLSTIDAIHRLLIPDCISVFICDHMSQEVWVCVNRGGIEGVSVKFGQGIAGSVAVNGQTIRVIDAYEDGRFDESLDRKTGYKTKSILCVGVPGCAANSKPVAVIQLLNKLNGKGFTQDDQDSLELLCKELSLSLRRKVEEMSFLRQATFGRNNPNKEKQLRLEESFLNEFGAVSQCYKFSTMIPNRCMEVEKNRSEEGATSGKYVTCDDETALRNREIINDWDFNPFTTSDSDLMQYSVQMLADFDLIEMFKIDIKKLKNYIMGAHALYHEDVQFHNFKHGWSVMHMSYLILRHGASKFLTPLDILAVLISALCHDLDHPGNNNAYEVASQSELALTHSYDAVLERHHASMTHRLLSSTNSSIFENLTPEEQTYMNGLVTDAILATNMAVHFEHVERLDIVSKNDPPFDVTSTSSRRDLVGHIVHAADLSGQVLSLELAKVWGERCLNEFMHQAKIEKENGYPVTQFMAALDTNLSRSRAQLGFVGNIVLPLWTSLAACFPSLDARCCQAQSNHDYYSNCIKLDLASPDEKDKDT